MKNDNALDHVDNIDGLLSRSGALLNFATTKLMRYDLLDDYVALLLWQVKENLEAMKDEVDALAREVNAGGDE